MPLKVWYILGESSFSFILFVLTGAELCLERFGVACRELKRTRRDAARVGEGTAGTIRSGLGSPSAVKVDVALTE